MYVFLVTSHIYDSGVLVEEIFLWFLTVELKARFGVKDILSEWSKKAQSIENILKNLSRRNVAWFLVVVAYGYVVLRKF